MLYLRIILLFTLLSLTGCSFANPWAATPVPTFAVEASAVPSATVAPQPSEQPSPVASVELAPTPTLLASPLPSPQPTPSPDFRNTEPVLTATPTLVPLSAEERTQLFDDVWTYVRDNYVYTDFRGNDWQAISDELRPLALQASTTEEFYGHVIAMIERLGDQHSRFDTPQDVAADEARAEGNRSYVGIGVVIRDGSDGGVVVRVATASPAEEVGLLPRDLIVAVNGIPFTDTERFGAYGPRGVIRAATDTPVILTIQRGQEPLRDVSLRSRVIASDALPTVEASIVPGTQVGLLLIDDFQLDNLDVLIKKSLDDLADRGPLDGLIIDVRTNLGGYVYQMENAIAFFSDGGVIGSTSGRSSKQEISIPEGQLHPDFVNLPVVVLISDETASAAEMFASGMQTLKRATIIGMPSAGNTENLIGHDLFDGSRVWLAEYIFERPDGSIIEDRGVQPDQLVDSEWWRYTPEGDPQIQAAIEAIQRQK